MKKSGAILVALFIVINMCFPVLSVFAQDAQDLQSDTFSEPETAAATAAVTLRAPLDDSQVEDGVSGFDELVEWLEENNTSGNTFTFSDSITVPAGEYVSVYGVALNTMNHSLIIKGNVAFGDDVKITGEGVNEKPVVTILSGGSLLTSGVQVEIAAVSEGGTAVKIESYGTFNEGFSNWCEIYSVGEGSVGIYAEGGLKLSYADIRSGGTGAIAGGDVELFMCDIAAAIPVETSGVVIFDTCIVSGESVPDATVISSKIADIDDNAKRKYTYRIAALGKNSGPSWYENERYLNVLLGDREQEQSIPVSWDTSVIDINTAGKYEINGTILAPYDRFELDSEFPIRSTVEIVDASLPVFYETSLGFGAYKYGIKFLYSADDLNGLMLWRSDDGETGWYDYTPYEFSYHGEEIWWLTLSNMTEPPVFLVFEVDGLGETQIFCVSWDDSGMRVEKGGDRYGDRGENTLPPTFGNPSGGTPSVSGTTPERRTTTERDNSYEPAETAQDSIPPVEEPTETMYAAAPSAPANEHGQSQLPQSSDKTGEAEPLGQDSEQDMVAPDTVAETDAYVQTIAAAPIEEATDATDNTDNTESTGNARSRKPYSDSVIPIVCVSSAGILGAGSYLGFAGKLSLKSLMKLLAGRLGI